MKTNVFIAIFFILALTSISLQAKGLKILFIGDSITDGNWGGGNAKPSSQRSLWDMNHIYGHGFMFLCAAHYMSENPNAEYEFFNRGISGNSLYGLEKRWKEDVLDIKPDVLSILVGINDILYYQQSDKSSPFDFQAWDKKYRELLDKAKQENPDLQIILASPFITPTGKMGEAEDFEDYNTMIKQCITIVKNIAKDYNAIYLPYQKMFDGILKKTPTTQNKYWIWDGVHPTAAGHQRMADMWIKQVDKKKILHP